MAVFRLTAAIHAMAKKRRPWMDIVANPFSWDAADKQVLSSDLIAQRLGVGLVQHHRTRLGLLLESGDSNSTLQPFRDPALGARVAPRGEALGAVAA